MYRESLLLLPAGVLLLIAGGWAGATPVVDDPAPAGFARSYSDTFDRAPTTSKPGGAGLGPLWNESPPGTGPHIADLADRAYCPQASTMIYIPSFSPTRGTYAEGLFRWVAPWPGGGIRFHLDATARIQPDGRHYLMKYRHEPELGVTPRIVLYRAGIGGSKQFWSERELAVYPPLDLSPRWVRVAVMDDGHGDPLVTGSVAWGGAHCDETGTLEDCEHLESLSAVDLGDPLDLSGTGGQVFLSVHHSDFELLHFNAGKAGATRVSLTEAVRAGPGRVGVPLSIEPIDGMTAAAIEVAYDARYLVATGVEPRPLLDGYMVDYDLDPPGWIHISLSSGQSGNGSGEALDLLFEALSPGCSLLDLVETQLNHGDLPSVVSDGHVLIQGTEDGDGDGYSEAAGDCSDRFAWIHPGAVERCDGADDDCDGVIDEGAVCACPRFPSPRRSDFWETACRGSNPQVQLGPAHVDSVKDTVTFADFGAVEPICALLLDPSVAVCDRAERAFLALLLNRGDDRLCDTQPIVSESTEATRVGEAIAELDAILAGPGCEPSQAARALTICDEVNTGQSIPDFLSEELQLWIESGGDRLVVLQWDWGDAAAAGRPLRFGILRSGPAPIDWLPLGVTRCPHWFPDRDCPCSPGILYLYEVVGTAP